MFLTCLVWFSIIVGLVIAIVLIIKIALEVKSLMNSSRDDKKDGLSPFWENFRRQYWVFMTTNVVRLFWIFYGVGTLYCLYQFKLNDSWAIKAIAGVTFGVFTMILLAATAKIFWLALHASHKKGGLEHLFSHQPWTAKYGLFYDCFQLKYWWFFVLFMSASFGRSAFLALGYGNGLLQVIGQLVIDLIFLVILLILKPFNTKMGNGINIAIAIVRVVSCCFLLAFTVELKVNSIKTTVVGMVLMIIQSVLMVVLAVLIMANAIWLLYRMVRNTSIVVVPKEEQDKGSINISQMGNLDEREYENEKSLCIEKDAISFLSMSQNSISTSDPIVFGQAHSTGRQFEGGHNYSHRIFTESTSHNDTKSLSSVETLPMAPYTISRKYPSSQSLVAHSFASTNPWPDNIDHGLNTIRVVGVNNNSTISLSSTSRDSISQTARNLDSAETEAKSTSRPRLIQSLSLYSVNSSLREPLYQPKFIEDWDGQPHNQDPADEADSGLAAETAK
ncbi:hypothetical protein NADFUDRAFT_84395 [Nadsonia fulvescens var. elongata DSM 6958]|uniref:TRP C-terminal domain-containing protein n=1 Tax=Nadsonia fulvescens var. elongata DSM 6958 TaxID=857566 RepID=A0A1E3PCS1_9ASCO|nr:hypothetical protein NADFUDRAFT_84395 [Nadsonia fulvescens var. elongata DSM 6958]